MKTDDIYTLVEKNKKNRDMRQKSNDEFFGYLNKAKEKFVDEMYSMAEEAFEELKCKIEEGSISSTIDIGVDSEFFRGSIEVQGKDKIFKFARHELWYGRMDKTNKWTNREKRHEDCAFNLLRQKLQKDKLYIYDVSDPEKSRNIRILLSIKKFEKKKDLWHNMNY